MYKRQHLIWAAISGRKDDLIEVRRKGRLWFALGMAIAAAISIAAEAFVYQTSPETVHFIRAVVTLPLAIWAMIWLLKLEPSHLVFETTPRAEIAESTISPKDRVTYETLVALMESDHFYRTQGLTIRTLSDHMKVPEHQLRALINQSLGYKNFSAFLNDYRLAEAKELLSDIEHARLPVLTIAMDVGFNSLAPFNRAFKLAEGITPTEYRRRALN